MDAETYTPTCILLAVIDEEEGRQRVREHGAPPNCSGRQAGCGPESYISRYTDVTAWPGGDAGRGAGCRGDQAARATSASLQSLGHAGSLGGLVKGSHAIPLVPRSKSAPGCLQVLMS